MIKNLYKFAEKSDKRVSCGAVYYDNTEKCAVVTNKLVLLSSKDDYSANLAGELVWKDGVHIEKGGSIETLNSDLTTNSRMFTYPSWTLVVPSPDREADFKKFDMTELKKVVAEAWAKAKLDGDTEGTKTVVVYQAASDRVLSMLVRDASLFTSLPEGGELWLDGLGHNDKYVVGGVSFTIFNVKTQEEPKDGWNILKYVWRS